MIILPSQVRAVKKKKSFVWGGLFVWAVFFSSLSSLQLSSTAETHVVVHKGLLQVFWNRVPRWLQMLTLSRFTNAAMNKGHLCREVGSIPVGGAVKNLCCWNIALNSDQFSLYGFFFMLRHEQHYFLFYAQVFPTCLLRSLLSLLVLPLKTLLIKTSKVASPVQS